MESSAWSVSPPTEAFNLSVELVLVNGEIGKVGYSNLIMAKSNFRIGDKVRVTGVKDELGTEKLFKSMIGKVYTVRSFDKYGNVELEPKRLNTVWVEPEFLKLRARKMKRRKAK